MPDGNLRILPAIGAFHRNGDGFCFRSDVLVNIPVNTIRTFNLRIGVDILIGQRRQSLQAILSQRSGIGEPSGRRVAVDRRN